MKINYFTVSIFTFLIMFFACKSTNVSQNINGKNEKFTITDDLIINLMDSVVVSTLDDNITGIGAAAGRKIIYRDLSAAKIATKVSGRISLKVCIDQDGIVKYSEVLQDSTTIKDINILKKYLRASMGYKFQSDYEAPKYQCGKLSFKLDYTLHNAKRR